MDERHEDHASDGRNYGRRTFLAGLGAGSAAGLAGYAGIDPSAASDTDAARQTTTTAEGTFVEASTSTAVGLHPLYDVTDDTTRNRLEKLYDGPGGQFGPDTFDPRWFASWELDDSNRVVEYELRDDLVWGGGYGQLDAEDYLYLLDNVVLLTGTDDWATATNTGSYRLGSNEEFVSYEKTGPLSLRAELPVPKPQWLHEDPLLDQLALPRDLLRPYVQNQDRDGLQADQDVRDGSLTQGESTLGPYEFVEWQRGSKWVFERNDDYYLKAHADEEPFASDPYYDFSNSPYFDQYEVQLFDESATALSALQTGEVDAASIDARRVENFRGQPGIDVWERPFGNFNGWMNMNHRVNGWAPIRESRDVRHALGNLFDKEIVVEQIYQDNAVPTATYHPDWGPYYPDAADLYEPDGSLARAKELLQSGTSTDYGYDGNGDFVGPDGTQVQLTAVRPTDNPSQELSAQYMRSRLEDAGIELDIQAVSFLSLLRNFAINSASNVDGVDQADWAVGSYNGGPWNQSASREQWDLMFGLAISADPYAPWDDISMAMAERGVFNLWGYHQDEMDIQSVLDDAATASDPQVTRETTTELFAFLSEDMPLAWTYSDVEFTGFREDISYFPGEAADWGATATSYFQDVDPARLLRRGSAQVPTTTERTTTERTTTERTTTKPTTTQRTTVPTENTTAPNATATTAVENATTTTDADGETTTEEDVEFDSDEIPGFGPLAAVAGLGGLAELARRRTGADDEDE